MSADEFEQVTGEYIAAVTEHQSAHAEFLDDIRNEIKRTRYEAAVGSVKTLGDRWRAAWKDRY